MENFLNNPKSAAWFLRATLLVFWPTIILCFMLHKIESLTLLALLISILPIFFYSQACFSIIPNLFHFEDVHLRKLAKKADLYWILFYLQPKLLILHPSYFFYSFFSGRIFSIFLYFIKVDPVLISIANKYD